MPCAACIVIVAVADIKVTRVKCEACLVVVVVKVA